MKKVKLDFKLNKSEFYMLLGLICIVFAVAGANYLVFPQWDKFRENTNTLGELRVKCQQMEIEFSKTDALKKQEAELSEKLTAEQLRLPGYISQEESVLELNDLSAKTSLTLNSIAYDAQQKQDAQTFMAAAESGGEAPKTPEAKPENKDAPDPAAEKDPFNVLSRAVRVSFSGSYESVYGFMGRVEKMNRRIFFKDLTMVRDTEGLLSGSLTMQYLGGTFGSEAGEPYKIDTPNTSGKLNPFTPYTGYMNGEAVVAASTVSPDFYMILNTYDDNASKIILGKYPKAETELYFNRNAPVSGSLTIGKSGSSYSYSYSIGSDRYAGSFKDDSTGLSLNVISKPRKSAGDKASITLDVKNTTGAPLKIKVENDDLSKPRFILGKTSGDVSLAQ